jgi:hypothetical protein
VFKIRLDQSAQVCDRDKKAEFGGAETHLDPPSWGIAWEARLDTIAWR